LREIWMVVTTSGTRTGPRLRGGAGGRLDAMTDRRETPNEAGWTFLSNHAHVLLCLARNPNVLMREVADAVGITERAVQHIVADLEAAGYLTRDRQGRRNHYEIRTDLLLRHPVERHVTISSLIELVLGDDVAE
jgi:DNA-binding transcriptional ArsR family regulator